MLLQDMTAQICNRSALADEVVDYYVIATVFNFAFKNCLSRESSEAACTGVVDNIRLYD